MILLACFGRSSLFSFFLHSLVPYFFFFIFFLFFFCFVFCLILCFLCCCMFCTYNTELFSLCSQQRKEFKGLSLRRAIKVSQIILILVRQVAARHILCSWMILNLQFRYMMVQHQKSLSFLIIVIKSVFEFRQGHQRFKKKKKKTGLINL